MNIRNFASGTERLINPITVGKIHYLQRWLNMLPRTWQRKIIANASKKAPKMGFVVEPYALFLFYELPDSKLATQFLPRGFIPAQAKVFQDDTEKYYGIASIFRVHTSTFWGARSEFYVVAKNEATGLLSWVILDYISDTISYDHKNGLRSAEAERAVVTTTCEGEILANIRHPVRNKRISCSASLTNPIARNLDEKLWIEGNTSIAYGKELAEKGDLFSLTFFPEEMAKAWEIPVKDVKVDELSWYPEIFGGRLAKVACFPFAQHMLSDSPSTSTFYGSKSALRAAAETIDFSKLREFK